MGSPVLTNVLLMFVVFLLWAVGEALEPTVMG